MRLAYILIVDGSFDQVCETKAQATKEIASLKKLGHTVKMKTCDWCMQDSVISKIEG